MRGEQFERAGGQPVVPADGHRQPGVGEFGEGGLALADVDQRGQVRRGGALAAERDGEPQHGLRGLAQPLGEPDGGRGGLGDGGQRDGAAQRVLADRRVGVADGLPDGAEDVHPVVLGGDQRVHGDVPLAQQGGGLDEAQRQALGLEPEVHRPGLLGDVQRPSGQSAGEGEAGGAGEPGDEVVLHPGAGRRRRAVRGDRHQEGAAGGGGEQVLQFGVGGLGRVDHDDRGDLGEVGGQPGGVGPVAGGVVGGGEEVLEQVGGGAAVAAELDDTAGGEVGGGFGDGRQQRAAARAGLADQAYRAALGEQAEEFGDVGLAVQQRQVGGPGAERERADRPADAADRAAGGLAASDPARAGLPLLGAGPGLGSVRGADSHQQAAGDQFTAAGADRLLPELPGWLCHVLLRIVLGRRRPAPAG